MTIWWAAALAAVAVYLLVPDGSLRRLRASPTAQRRSPHDGPAWRRWFSTRAAQRREQALKAGVASVCDLLAVCVEAGRPPRSALLVVAEAVGEPARGALLGVWNQLDLGVPDEKAWASLAEQPGYAGVARDLARSVSSGIALADLLRLHARSARVEAAAASLMRARAVSVTGVIPLMVCFLPAFLLVGVVPLFGGLLKRFLGW